MQGLQKKLMKRSDRSSTGNTSKTKIDLNSKDICEQKKSERDKVNIYLIKVLKTKRIRKKQFKQLLGKEYQKVFLGSRESEPLK